MGHVGGDARERVEDWRERNGYDYFGYNEDDWIPPAAGYDNRQTSEDLAERPAPVRTPALAHHGSACAGYEGNSGRGSWHTGQNASDLIAKDCSFLSDHKTPNTDIFIDAKVANAIRYLMKKSDAEWQMLLIGDVEEKEEGYHIVNVSDYYIPLQEVTGTTVRNTDCIDQQTIADKHIVATLHSHVSMGAFFSQTDMTECNSSPIKYHVVMNNKLEYSAIRQHKLPCGLLKFGKAQLLFDDVSYEIPNGIDNIRNGRTTDNATWRTDSKPSSVN